MASLQKFGNPETEGTPLDLKTANSLIAEYIDLQSKSKMVPNLLGAKGTTEEINKLSVFCQEDPSKRYNAFIFTKDLIMRFFDGSETDEDGNPKSANFLMVILGAHPETKEGFEAGSSTVLTVGCERKQQLITEGENKGKEKITFHPLAIAQVANEYPPHQFIQKFEPGFSDSENNFLYFEQIQ